MSSKEPTTEEVLEKLAGVLTRDLLTRIESGEAAPSTLNVARQWLKDNNMELNPNNQESANLHDVLKGLPFGDETNTTTPSTEGTERLQKLPSPSLALFRSSEAN
jgi:hypothetical protein